MKRDVCEGESSLMTDTLTNLNIQNSAFHVWTVIYNLVDICHNQKWIKLGWMSRTRTVRSTYFILDLVMKITLIINSVVVLSNVYMTRLGSWETIKLVEFDKSNVDTANGDLILNYTDAETLMADCNLSY